MTVVHLSANEAKSDEKLAKLLEELRDLQQPKPYRTYVTDHKYEHHFYLVTTSKDIHLMLGKLTQSARLTFCRYLAWSFADLEAELSLTVEQEDGSASKPLFITKSVIGTEIHFHLAPSR